MAQVLIIEDDDRIRPLLMRALGERGYAVSSARTGMDGLHQAVENRPDLVILDLGLPDIDGTQVLSMLRAVSEVPVIKDGELAVAYKMKITLSADHRISDGAEVARFLQAVKGYLEKPLRLVL